MANQRTLLSHYNRNQHQKNARARLTYCTEHHNQSTRASSNTTSRPGCVSKHGVGDCTEVCTISKSSYDAMTSSLQAFCCTRPQRMLPEGKHVCTCRRNAPIQTCCCAPSHKHQQRFHPLNADCRLHLHMACPKPPAVIPCKHEPGPPPHLFASISLTLTKHRHMSTTQFSNAAPASTNAQRATQAGTWCQPSARRPNPRVHPKQHAPAAAALHNWHASRARSTASERPATQPKL